MLWGHVTRESPSPEMRHQDLWWRGGAEMLSMPPAFRCRREIGEMGFCPTYPWPAMVLTVAGATAPRLMAIPLPEGSDAPHSPELVGDNGGSDNAEASYRHTGGVDHR